MAPIGRHLPPESCCPATVTTEAPVVPVAPNYQLTAYMGNLAELLSRCEHYGMIRQGVVKTLQSRRDGGQNLQQVLIGQCYATL